eukprot:SAG11_NODE_2608_length_3175_cov_1.390442_2_plen_81_part_00
MGNWLPHVTVVQGVPVDEGQHGDALVQMLAALPQLPIEATVASIGLISFRPGTDLCTFALGTGEELPVSPAQISSSQAKL